MNRYKTYKTVNLNWVDEIPSHWNLVGANILFADNKTKNAGMIENNILSLSYGNIVKKKGEENFGLIPANYETYQVVNPGFIVLRLTDMQNDHTSLRVGLVKEKGIITSAYTGLIPKGNVNATYYYYLLHTLDLTKFIYILGGGVRQSSDYNELKKLKFPFPPEEEQEAIGNYLDAQYEKINLFIANKQKLIQLLKEQRQSIINEALQNENEKWQTRKLKFVAKVNEKTLGESTSPEYEFTYLDISSVDEGGNTSEVIQKIKFANAPSRARRVVRKNDVIISTVRTYLQAITYFDGEVNDVVVSTGYAVFTPNTKIIHPDFLNYAVRKKEFLNSVTASSTGIAYPAITSTKLSNFKIILPTLDEQHKIVKHIKEETSRIDEAIGRIEKEIELIKEYKQSIVAEVVTGKIKVIAD